MLNNKTTETEIIQEDRFWVQCSLSLSLSLPPFPFFLYLFPSLPPSLPPFSTFYSTERAQWLRSHYLLLPFRKRRSGVHYDTSNYPIIIAVEQYKWQHLRSCIYIQDDDRWAPGNWLQTQRGSQKKVMKERFTKECVAMQGIKWKLH